MPSEADEMTSPTHRYENLETADIFLLFRYELYVLCGLERQEPDENSCCVFNFSTSCLLPILSLLILTWNEGRSLDFSALSLASFPQPSLSRVFRVSYVLQKLQWNPISKFGNFTAISSLHLKLFKPSTIITTKEQGIEEAANLSKVTWLE